MTRVVRIRHHWICNPVLAPETPIPPPPQPPAPPPPGSPAPEPEANAVGVIADDHGGVFSYTRTRESVKAGAVTIDLSNRGEDEHNLNLVAESPEGAPEGETLGAIGNLLSEGHGSATLDLPPGRYLMYCSIGHHAEHGMRATLIVE